MTRLSSGFSAVMRRFREADSERGATAILVAMTIVFLMGMAALAVDAGILFEDRRQEQAGADVAALAAVQFAKTNLPTALCGGLLDEELAACRGAEEAMDVVDGTLPGRYSIADWTACVDPTLPAEYTQDSMPGGSPCINYTENFQKARVFLPGTDVNTAFARVIGVDTVLISAFAEATLDLNQTADVWPFAVGPTGAGSNQACLFANSSSNLDVDPCNGPTEGNFGKLDLALYGNNTYGTPEICGNAMSGLKIATNIILGADHLIEEEFKSPGTLMDFATCPVLTNPVDNLRTQTGNSASGIANGLWGGISPPDILPPAREGRITCKDGDPGEGDNISPTGSWPCQNINNLMPETLDNTPLWHYLTGSVTEVSPANSCDAVTDRQEMEICLQAWRDYGPHPASSSLFTATLETAPRFGAIPKLDSDPSNGSGDYDVVEFIPAYLETLFLKCNANTCDIVFSPGEASTGACPDPLTPLDNSCGWFLAGNKGLVALTAFMMRMDMLHSDIREFFPGSQGTLIINLSR